MIGGTTTCCSCMEGAVLVPKALQGGRTEGFDVQKLRNKLGGGGPKVQFLKELCDQGARKKKRD